MNVRQTVIKAVGGLTGDGLLPAFAWPGGYPILYLDKDCEPLCADCATKSDWSDAEVIAADVYWEGPTLQCANCNCEIESAYGDPEVETGE